MKRGKVRKRRMNLRMYNALKSTWRMKLGGSGRLYKCVRIVCGRQKIGVNHIRDVLKRASIEALRINLATGTNSVGIP